MGVVVSLIVFAVGAIFRYGMNVHSATWNVKAIGDILMVVGVVGFVLAVIAWAYWDGFGWGGIARRRRTTVIGDTRGVVHGPDGYARTSYEPTYLSPHTAPMAALPADMVVEEEEHHPVL